MIDGFLVGHLAWIAGGLYALAYLVINQVILRLLVLVGTGFYIWYYWVVADAPLWDAVIISIVLAIANLIGLANLFLHKSRLYVPVAHRDLYDGPFTDMPPADFRELMRGCKRETLTQTTTITEEGMPVRNLFFVVSGNIMIEKLNERFSMPPGFFVGEIAYLTGRRSSATTYLPAGAEVLIWDSADLKLKSSRRPRFKMAFEATISRDLAMKVAVAVAPHQDDWDAERARQELVAQA